MICFTFLSAYENASFYPQGFFEIRQEDVSISYLPLAHMFERMIQVSAVSDIRCYLSCVDLLPNS